jgi:hypothetical protein
MVDHRESTSVLDGLRTHRGALSEGRTVSFANSAMRLSLALRRQSIRSRAASSCHRRPQLSASHAVEDTAGVLRRTVASSSSTICSGTA